MYEKLRQGIFLLLVLLGFPFLLGAQTNNEAPQTSIVVVSNQSKVPLSLKLILDSSIEGKYQVTLLTQEVKIRTRKRQRARGFSTTTETSKVQWEELENLSYKVISLVVPKTAEVPGDIEEQIDTIAEFNIVKGNDVLEVTKVEGVFSDRLSNALLTQLKEALTQVTFPVEVDDKTLANALQGSEVKVDAGQLEDLKRFLSQKPVSLSDEQIRDLKNGLSQTPITASIDPSDFAGLMASSQVQMDDRQLNELKNELSKAFSESKVSISEKQLDSLKDSLSKADVKAEVDPKTIASAMGQNAVKLEDAQLQELKDELQKIKVSPDEEKMKQLLKDWQSSEGYSESVGKQLSGAIGTQLSQAIDEHLSKEIGKHLASALKNMKEEDTQLENASLEELEQAMELAFREADYTKGLDIAASAMRKTSQVKEQKDIFIKFGTLFLKLGAQHWQHAASLVKEDDGLQKNSKEVNDFVDEIIQ